ncbi:MAG: hypothetical protein CMA85_00085 [Euryarchaeota archaeon]|nr:hypothetical protein [Euryarchaeota archaeon]
MNPVNQYPTPIRRTSRRNYWRNRMTNEHEEMNRRIENGEFGSPPDLNLVNQAWANLLEKEIVNRGRKSVYHGVCSLWNDSGKVLLSGRTQEATTIPEGVKVLVLKKDPEPGTRQPDASIVFVTYED